MSKLLQRFRLVNKFSFLILRSLMEHGTCNFTSLNTFVF
jgi:hypothetical protein